MRERKRIYFLTFSSLSGEKKVLILMMREDFRLVLVLLFVLPNLEDGVFTLGEVEWDLCNEKTCFFGVVGGDGRVSAGFVPFPSIDFFSGAVAGTGMEPPDDLRVLLIGAWVENERSSGAASGVVTDDLVTNPGSLTGTIGIETLRDTVSAAAVFGSEMGVGGPSGMANSGSVGGTGTGSLSAISAGMVMSASVG